MDLIAERFDCDGDAILYAETPTGFPVVSDLVSRGGAATLRVAMNTTKRLLLGVFSSLLLAVGFARAADRVDPMSVSLSSNLDSPVAYGPAEPCVPPCDDDAY